MAGKRPPHSPGLVIPPAHYFVGLIDYTVVVTVYVLVGLALGVIINGYILPEYSQQVTDATPTAELTAQIVLQMAIQTFIALMLYLWFQKVPSIVEGVAGYKSNTPFGVLLRNPGAMMLILFITSFSLQARISSLVSRFDKSQLIRLKTYSSTPPPPTTTAAS